MVRFRLVIEPEDTGLVLAEFYELEIGFHKQFGGCFRNGRQNRFSGVLLPHDVDSQRLRLIPYESRVTPASHEIAVKDGRVSSSPCLPSFHEEADIFSQLSCGV
jgi:hypothetical protein